MSMRTPLRQVRGLGSARSGTEHFWHQRLTAMANIPLTIGFVVVVASLMGRNHAAVDFGGRRARRVGHGGYTPNESLRIANAEVSATTTAKNVLAISSVNLATSA